MNLQQCYTALGGDYQDVANRLFNEAMVRKFVLKFLDDHSFSDLCTAMETTDYARAFMASHTLKGICQNLSFTRLFQSTQRLTEELRSGAPDVQNAQELFAQVKEDYRITADAIRRLQADS